MKNVWWHPLPVKLDTKQRDLRLQDQNTFLPRYGCSTLGEQEGGDEVKGMKRAGMAHLVAVLVIIIAILVILLIIGII